MAKHTGRLSPRQRMINLMYLVLTAMLALNVSSDVLDGFTQVEDGLSRSNATMSLRNDAILERLRAFAAQNPEKGGVWLGKAEEVKAETDRLLADVDALKLAIVRKCDGEDGDPANILKTYDMESAGAVMLNPVSREGAKLRGKIDKFRDYITGMVADSVKRSGIEMALSTASVRFKGSDIDRKWEEAKFENQPVVAAVALLTKLQGDIRFAEGEALANLLGSVDAGDLRVNRINAFVIPESRLVMRGDKYSADIVLAAVDTTSRPAVFVNGNKLTNGDGKYEFTAGTAGTFDYSGYLEVMHDDGSVSKHPFSSEYTVIEPVATVSATMMNVLYAGIDNPVSISVPGVDRKSISASMTNGTLVRQGDIWVARPSSVGQDAVISISASGTGGTPHQAGSMTFKVRRLPDPTAYIKSGGDAAMRISGQQPVAKAQLVASPGVGAAIDDGILDIEFKVTSFETVFVDQMGNSIPEKSDGDKFSSRQLDKIKRLARGKRFYVSRIRAIGPDGTERSLSPVEVIVK